MELRNVEKLFADLEGGKVTKIKRLYSENFLVDESIWEGIARGKPFGVEGNGRPLKFRLLHIIEFSEDGFIKGGKCLDRLGFYNPAITIIPNHSQ